MKITLAKANNMQVIIDIHKWSGIFRFFNPAFLGEISSAIGSFRYTNSYVRSKGKGNRCSSHSETDRHGRVTINVREIEQV